MIYIIYGAGEFSDLFTAARDYVRRIEDILGVGAMIVPVGPKRR